MCCSNECTCQTSDQYVDIYIVISERREKIFEDLDGMMGLASNGSNFVNPRVPISKLVWFGLGVNCWNGHFLVRAEYSRYLRLAIKVSTDFMGQEWKLSLIPNVIFHILKHSPYSFFGFCRLLSGSTPHNFQLVPDGFWRKKHPRSIFFVEKGVESRRFLLNRQFGRKTRWNRSRTTWWVVFSSGRVIYNKGVPIEEMNQEICKWFPGLFKVA